MRASQASNSRKRNYTTFQLGEIGCCGFSLLNCDAPGRVPAMSEHRIGQ